MSDETKSKPLTSEILAEAHKQSERKISGAKKNAEEITHSAQAKVASIEHDTVNQAQESLDQQSRLILADVPHQNQVRALQVQQQVIEVLFSDAVQKLLTDDSQRSDSVLTALADKSVEQIMSDSIVLELSQKDTKLGDNVIRALRAKYAGKTFAAATNAKIEGGVIARSADGRQMVDNTFKSRLHRMQRELRSKLTQLIFGETQA